MSKKPLTFPSGRTVDRVKKDAKARAKELSIPLSAAQDQLAEQNGMTGNWGEDIRKLKAELGPEDASRPQRPESGNPLADYLGLTAAQLEELDPEIEANYGHSGEMLYNYYFYVPEHTPEELLDEKGWAVGDLVDDIPIWLFDTPDDEVFW